MGGHNNRLAGATRTFREPELMFDLHGGKKMDVPAHPPSSGRSSAAAGNYSAIIQEEESESLVVAEEGGPPAAAIGRIGRQTSLKQWLTKKANYAFVQTEQASELLSGTDQKAEVTPPQEQPGYDTGGDADETENGDGEANPTDFSSGTFEPPQDETQRVGGENCFVTYVQGHNSSPAKESSPLAGSGESTNVSEDQPLAHEPTIDIFDDDKNNTSPQGDKISRHVTFLSGTMGLTLDMSEVSQPQQQQQGDEEQYPASPCSGVILETSPRYGSLQVFRKQMAIHGINAQVCVISRAAFTSFLEAHKRFAIWSP